MTTAQKTGIGAIVAVLLIGALALYQKDAKDTVQNNGILMTAPSDTSDQGLNSDSAAIDAQLSGLATDTATIDQSIEAGAQ